MRVQMKILTSETISKELVDKYMNFYSDYGRIMIISLIKNNLHPLKV